MIKTKGRNTQLKTEFTMKRTVFGTKSKAIILSPAYHFPKEKTSLSAFGGSATCGILSSISESFTPIC